MMASFPKIDAQQILWNTGFLEIFDCGDPSQEMTAPIWIDIILWPSTRPYIIWSIKVARVMLGFLKLVSFFLNSFLSFLSLNDIFKDSPFAALYLWLQPIYIFLRQIQRKVPVWIINHGCSLQLVCWSPFWQNCIFAQYLSKTHVFKRCHKCNCRPFPMSHFKDLKCDWKYTCGFWIAF